MGGAIAISPNTISGGHNTRWKQLMAERASAQAI
jgi:hypothetical protein